MSKIKILKKLSTKEQCAIAMLIAITAILGYISGYLRIGNISKFSISFISVYISAVLFGPLIGGFVGAAADIVSFVTNPTGAYIWQFTVIEFFYGFIFGLFFFSQVEKENKKIFWLKVIICVLIQFCVNIGIKTFVLMNVGYLPQNFILSASMRMPSCAVMAVIQIIALGILEPFIPVFLKLIRK